MKKTVRNTVLTALLSSFLTMLVMGQEAQAGAGGTAMGAEIKAAMTGLIDWLENGMMDALKSDFQKETDDISNNITNKLDENFKYASQMEQMAGALTSQFSQSFNNQRESASQVANDNSKGYLNYTQGSASGYDASTKPAAVISDMNKRYTEVQAENTNCKLNNPQYAGMNDDQCTTAQLEYTNALLAGVTPLPTYSATQEESPVGQQYALEREESITRQQLASKAVGNATSKQTKKIIDDISSTLASPTRDEINKESDAAVQRDTLMILQELGDIQVKQYQAELENQRLLGTLVSQNEEIHAQYMREMQKQMAH